MAVTVAIVEDDADVRLGLCFLINSAAGFRCVTNCGSAEEALESMPEIKPDIILMDIQLPGMSGIECIPRLRELLPSTQIMMLTVFEDHDRIFQSLAAGATGYLIKKTEPAKILEALRDLHQGGSPMSNQIARRVVEAFQIPPAANACLQSLSQREQEVLALLAKGFLYKEIADKLVISIQTVRTHIRNIYDKLHVHTRTEAVLKTR